MSDDLLDAYASVNWAKAQIPILQQRFGSWQQECPYTLGFEPDPDTGDKLLVARERIPLDPIINADVGSIINACRSSLDMVAAALSNRNGVIPNRETHFPIHRYRKHLLSDLKGIKNKKWLSKSEIATIKSLKPYKRGDAHLFPILRLDNLRKHERLIDVVPKIGEAHLTIVIHGARQEWRHLPDKTILIRYPPNTPDFPISQRNSNLIAEVTFNEASLGLRDEPAIPRLRQFIARCRGIIEMFDAR